MAHESDDDALRPFSRRVTFTAGGGGMMAVIDAMDRIAALVCPDHDLNPAVATTFSGTGYVSACCEAMLDRIEAEVARQA
ncbi:MAG TPA: hypothetical protein VFL80_04285 [Thermoanaerobaculia bacterium]|nr:hypothetical protein [Thermoanaerobaculia bacterium]